MRASVLTTIDQLGVDSLKLLDGSRLDFSYGLLRAIERSLWGGMTVRYVAVENCGALVSFAPVYIGSNLEFNSLMPRFIQRAYHCMIRQLGRVAAYRAAIIGSLISDRGWIPMRPDCDRQSVLKLLLNSLDLVARSMGAQFCCIKDIHQEFPNTNEILEAGFSQAYSLPTVRVPTAFKSFDGYLESLTRNGRKHARKVLRRADGQLTIRLVRDYASLIPVVYPLFRSTFLKAGYQFEELPPHFFLECARSEYPSTELMVCEKAGRIVGAMLILFNECEQLNKRIGLDYTQSDTGTIYNLLMYEGLRLAVERGIRTVYLGQSTYIPKIRMGGKLENEYLFLKAYSQAFRLSIPLQRLWMQRYQADRVLARVREDGSA